MIILAAVSVSAAINGNLIGLAGKAADDYKKAEKEESDLFKNLSNFAEDVMANLSGGKGTGGDDEEEKTTVTAKDLTEANYGEYVDYGLNINGNGTTTDDWRIFYVGGEEDGDAKDRIFLIAADYVPQNCEALTIALSSAGIEDISGDTYECWAWDTAPDYHCNDGHNTELNQKTEDGQSKVQCSFPNLFMSTGYYCSSHVGTDGKSGNENARCASSLQCTENWKPFVEKSTNKQYADYAIGGPTLEMWVKSWNQKHGNSSTDIAKQEIYINTSSVYGYCIGTQIDPDDSCYVDLSSCDGYGDTLYFSHHESDNLELDGSGDANESCPSYYLASPSAVSSSSLMYADGAAYVGNYGVAGSACGIRPLVCLKSDVKLTKNEAKSSDEKVVYDLSM